MHDAYPLGVEPGPDVVGLRLREALDPGVDPGEVDARSVLVVELDAELAGTLDRRHQLGGRDQGLARHAVGEHRRPADALAVHDRHVGAQLGSDERRLVAAGSAAEDRHARHRSIIADPEAV